MKESEKSTPSISTHTHTATTDKKWTLNHIALCEMHDLFVCYVNDIRQQLTYTDTEHNVSHTSSNVLRLHSRTLSIAIDLLK